VGITLASVIVASGVALLVLPGDNEGIDTPSTASRAIARVDDNDGRVYLGTIDDAADPVRLRRALRAEFRSDARRPDPRGSAEAARRCAPALQRTSGQSRGRIVELADATYSGAPAVVVGITDRGRVVAFVADAETCEVRAAQSL
jgi:hypothetical protein